MLPLKPTDQSLKDTFLPQNTEMELAYIGTPSGSNNAREEKTDLEVYEWNALAISRIEFPSVTSEDIRPLWYAIFSSQKRVSTQLDIRWPAISFVMENHLHFLSLYSRGSEIRKHLACLNVWHSKFSIARTDDLQSILHAKQCLWDSFIIEDIHGRILLGLGKETQNREPYVRLTGPNRFLDIEYGFSTIYAISNDLRQLWSAEIDEVPADGVNIELTRETRFIGLAIARVSSVQHTAILTSQGVVFITGPLLSHLPGPYMIRWEVPDDVPITCEMALTCVMLATRRGHIYKLSLRHYWKHPQLIYANEDYSAKKIKYCGNNTFLALTQQNSLLIWYEDTDEALTHEHFGKLPLVYSNNVAQRRRNQVQPKLDNDHYPAHVFSRALAPTPVVLPWPIEDASLYGSFLFVSSTRRFSHNAMFANFLNRAALTTPGLPPMAWMDLKEDAGLPRPPFTKNREAQAYYLERLKDYGYLPKTRTNLGYSYQSADRRALNSSRSAFFASSSEASSSLRTSAETSVSSYEAQASSSNASDGLEPVLTQSRGNSLAEIGYGQYAYPYLPYKERKEALNGYSASHGYGTMYRPSAISSLPSAVSLQSERPLYVFNSKLLAVYSMSSVSPKSSFERQLYFARLNSEFLDMATQVVKIIVEEMNLPDEKKTYSSLPSAGIAGGEKYFVGGEIFVKLCVDNNSLYGGNEWSGKVANLELHGMDAYANLAMHENKLRVPLLTMVEYLGFRALVSTACPISKRTIVYGSNNAAATVHRDDLVHRMMLSHASVLNLAPHLVKNCDQDLASAVDVEVHRGEDQHLYLIDAARVFPPVLPDVVKSVPLACNYTESMIQAKDLSDGQATAIMNNMASLPISEGVLFFTKPSEDAVRDEESTHLIDTLSPSSSEANDLTENPPRAIDHPADAAAKFERQRQNLSDALSSRSERTFLDPSDEATKADLSALDQIQNDTITPQQTEINAIATAILGRVVRGDAWILKNAIGQRLFHQFRPEFVRSYSKPMSSDALSNFSVNGQAHDKVVTEASIHLQRALLDIVHQQLLSACPYLDKRLPGARKRPETWFSSPIPLSPLIYSPETLVRFLHSVGVNVRYLGYLRNCIDLQALKSMALIEMVARCCSNFIKRRIRASHGLHATCQAYLQKESQGSSAAQEARTNSSYSNISLHDWDTLSPDALLYFARHPLEHLMKTIAVQTFNTIFDNSATSSFFWTQVLKVQLLVKFGPDCLSGHEMHRTYSLREDVPMAYLFQVVSRRTGIIWDADTMNKLETAQWATTPTTFSLDQVLGFSITTKSTAMGSLQKVKEELRGMIFPSFVRVLVPIPESSHNDAHISHEVLNQYYSHVGQTGLESEASGPFMFDPMYLPSTDSPGPAKPATSTKKLPFTKPAGIWSGGSPYLREDGLDTYHERTILFYHKWVSKLKKLLIMPSPLDEVRLMLSKIRPILDNRCPGGLEQLDTLETAWLEILEKMKTISHCNQELLAQLFYARGQMVELRGDRRLAGDYYFASLNTLVAANFSEPTSKDSRQWICHKPTFLAKTHHFMTHPFAMLVIEKLLLLELEASGSIIASYRLMALFRQLWVVCPFLGDADARRRIFNGRAAPIALSDPNLWKNSGYLPPNQITTKPSSELKEHSPVFAFVPHAVFSLKSQECQFWLSQVLDLDSTCGFEVSTHWLFQEPSNYPHLMLRSFPSAMDFPSFIHTPTFQPTSSLRVVHSLLSTSVEGGASTWCWWLRFEDFPSSEFLQVNRLVPSADLGLSIGLSASNGARLPTTIEVLLFYALRKAAGLAGSIDFQAPLSKDGFALPRDNAAQPIDHHQEDARSSQLMAPTDPTKCTLFALGNFLIHESGTSINTFPKLLEMRSSVLAMLGEAETLGTGAVAANFLDPIQRLDLYGPVAQLIHGARIKFYLKRDTPNQSAYFQNNGIFMMDNLGIKEFLCATVQYLDPNLPAPKRFMLHISDEPESYTVLALPLWFDEFGILSLERFGLSCFIRAAYSGPKQQTWSFYSVTNRGTIVSGMPKNFVHLSNKDIEELKQVNFAGEQPILLHKNKMRPKRLRDGNYTRMTYLEDEATVACITRDGHLFIWGSNKAGLFGTGRINDKQSFSPKLVSELSASKIIDFEMGSGHIVTLNEVGDVYMWGFLLPPAEEVYYVPTSTLAFEQTRHSIELSPIPKELPTWGGIIKQRAVAVAAALHSIMAISEFGIPYHLGFRSDLQTFSVKWIRIWCPERIVSVACGDFHTVLLSENGNVFAFGNNESGQCGTPFPLMVDGFNRCLAPIQFSCNAIPGSYSLKFVQIVACKNHSLALTDTGDVWLWGSAPRSSPYRIRTPVPIKYISFNSEGHHMMFTEMPDLPPRTLPLASVEHQRQQASKIHDYRGLLDTEAREEAIAKANKEAHRLRIRDKTLLQHYESTANANKVPADREQQPTEQDANSSANESSTVTTPAVASSSNQPTHGESPSLELEVMSPPGEDSKQQPDLSLKHYQTIFENNPGGLSLRLAINNMIAEALTPLQAQITELKSEIASLKRLEERRLREKERRKTNN